jgi:hypothetical protein
MFLIYACIESVLDPVSVFALMGGVIFFLPILLYALGEWAAFFRSNRRIERQLGFLNLVGAGFVAFGIITNVGEAIIYRFPIEATWLLSFLLIGFTLFAYLALCGVFRIHRAPSGNVVSAQQGDAQ